MRREKTLSIVSPPKAFKIPQAPQLATKSRKHESLIWISCFRVFVAIVLDGGCFRDLQVEQLLGVVLEDLLLVLRRQPLDRLDREPRLVQPSSRPRILDG